MIIFLGVFVLRRMLMLMNIWCEFGMKVLKFLLFIRMIDGFEFVIFVILKIGRV